MKIKHIFLALLVYVFFSACTSGKQSSDGLIVIDVSQDHPEKEIHLEEIADIEYLQLELNDDYLFNSLPQVITRDKIIISQFSNKDILLFSRDGKPLSKFNRKGNGVGEYTDISRLMYDETTDEIFVKSNNNILIYSITGDYKRETPVEEKLHFTEGISFNENTNFDSGSFLFHDKANRFSIVSKADGSIMDSIEIPAGKEVVLEVRRGNATFVAFPYHFVRHKDGFLLTDYTADTVFFLSREKELSPVLVRKPKIQSMDPVVYLDSFVEGGNYIFLTAVMVQLENDGGRFPRTYLMHNKKTGSVYRQKITFNDYKGKQINISPETIASTQDSRIGIGRP